ncbi:MAG: GGDEF domain-containing protein, partial [Pseudomonadota bacterium]
FVTPLRLMSQALPLDFQALDALMPMHAIVASTGHIVHAGPTLNKLNAPMGFVGKRLLEAFEVRRPREARLIRDLIQDGGTRVSLRLRDGSDVRLQGIALPLQNGELMVNLSFGISLADAIRAFKLSASDFATTDLAIEMLYLAEAKEAVSAESRSLNLRLLGAKSDAEEAAFTDALTGLKNRRALDMVLARYRSGRDPFTLMHLDLDHFKEVNDTLGHAAGDAVLMRVAQVLTLETREHDTIIRVGGDEFVLIFDQLTDTQALRQISQRIISRLEQPIDYEGQACRISGSIGITMSDDYAEVEPAQMLVDADVALYAAKKAGRATFRFVREVGGVGQSATALAEAPPLPRSS